MINLEELLEVIDENEPVVGGVRYIAEYLTNKKYCCHRDFNCNDFDYCIECWMMTLTNEVNEPKKKGVK